MRLNRGRLQSNNTTQHNPPLPHFKPVQLRHLTPFQILKPTKLRFFHHTTLVKSSQKMMSVISQRTLGKDFLLPPSKLALPTFYWSPLSNISPTPAPALSSTRERHSNGRSSSFMVTTTTIKHREHLSQSQD